MRKCRSLVGYFVLMILWLGLGGCEKKERGPVEVTSAKDANEIKAVIGKEGGVLRFAEMGAKLEIPANLLQEEVSVTLRREQPTFDISGKDFVGKAYRISPRLDFAPGTAKLYVPIDKALPGLPADVNLRMYYYDRLESEGPQGAVFVHEWQPHKLTKFSGFSSDQKYLVFVVPQTISDRTTKPPFGLFQAGFDM